jgi:hypothetical protein
MKRGNYMMCWLAAAAVAIVAALSVPGIAYSGAPRSPQQRNAGPAASSAQRQQPARAQALGHGGDWLRRYKDVPPAEQERELQNDPKFHRLPPEKQQQIRQRLQRFSSLSPQQQLRVLNRQETWEHLTPGQRQQVRQIQQLPSDRRRMVVTAARDLATMPPQQREQIINSERFRKMFSDQERDMLRGASHLPFSPADGGGEAAPQQ